MDVTVRVIPHEDQRYETVGDWVFISADHLTVTVSDLGNPIFNFLVALHEQVEAIACREAGIDEKDVTAFDMQFESERECGMHGPEDEPGDSIDAPYHTQHVLATKIEKEMADALGINWGDYEKAIYAL